MKKILCLLLLQAFNPLFGGELYITLRRVSANVLSFQTIYKGEKTELALPPRARLTAFRGEDASVEPKDTRARIGLRVGEGTEFTYEIIAGRNPDYGLVLESWYPLSKNTALSNHYTLRVEKEAAFIYPYLQREEAVYQFGLEEAPKLVYTRFTRLSEQGTPPITVFQGLGMEAEPDEIRRIYQHNISIYGDRGFDEIIILNVPQAPEGIVHAGKKLFLLMPNRGTLRQFGRLIPDAWMDAAPSLSPRIFAMFKDAALRFKPIDMPPNTLGSYVTDPLWVEASGTKEYYQKLFAVGLDNNGKGLELVDVRADMLLENNPMLRLADKHLGLDAFFTGLKALFQKKEAPAFPAEAKDYEKVEWSLLFQNRLSEPLLSFFTKDAFRPGFIAALKAESNAIARNSDFIPNFRIFKDKGESLSIDWAGKRSLPMPITSGRLTLDTDRLVPKLNYIDAFYTFDKEEQAQRALILKRAASLKTPSVEAFRQHLELLSFPAPAGNPYEIEEGRTVFVAVSVVLSTASGGLKPAIQEAFFILDENSQALSVTTRIRI